MDDTLGQRLRKLRESRNLSQTDVGRLAGVSSRAISSYETDAREPSFGILKSLARIYKVSTDYLLGVSSDQIIKTDGLDNQDMKLLSEIVDYMHKKNEQ